MFLQKKWEKPMDEKGKFVKMTVSGAGKSADTVKVPKRQSFSEFAQILC